MNKVIFSGVKGGMGNSTILANTAMILSTSFNRKTIILDLNFYNSILIDMFFAGKARIDIEDKKMSPFKLYNNLYIISNELLVSSKELPIIMRSNFAKVLAENILNDIKWDEFDYVLIDFPDYISDEIPACIEYFEKIDAGIIVSSPNISNLNNIERVKHFYEQNKIPLLGLIANMGKNNEDGKAVFYYDGFNEKMNELGINTITEIPFSRDILSSLLNYTPYVEKFKDSSNIQKFTKIANDIIDKVENDKK